jgi:homopolymeric O-antigen transport system ATP-binding protein
MGDVAIQSARLGKQYRIGARQKYKALRDTLTDAIAFSIRRGRTFLSTRENTRQTTNAIWALKDVSFEIKQGEVVGVIGRNGAGKSTLLKILSRITEPTEGYVDLHGRVGSLLEVGTGFHPELTGRENVYLNGSIIGMKKREIDRKFDEIVAFAEIEQFLDMPVKYYSTGMYMRLAFAVAAHLEPEILLVDEVLAVGDAAFQKKCIGKMRGIANEGRTVMFVSHNMPAVRSLCQQCMVIDKGRVALVGSVDDGIKYYLSETASDRFEPSIVFQERLTRPLWMRSANLICDGAIAASLPMGGTLSLSIDFASKLSIRHPKLGFVLKADNGIAVLNANNRYQSSPQYDTSVTEGTIRCDLGMVPLAAGRYSVDLYLGDLSEDTHVEQDALMFEVIEKDIWGHGRVPPPNISCLWWPTRFHFMTPEPSNLSLHVR